MFISQNHIAFYQTGRWIESKIWHKYVDITYINIKDLEKERLKEKLFINFWLQDARGDIRHERAQSKQSILCWLLLDMFLTFKTG